MSHDQNPDPQAPSRSDWAGPSGPIGAYIAEQSSSTLEAYRSQPNLVNEHANHEEDTARGGYAHRQLLELVQNGADALAGSGAGRIWVELTATHFYCADEGRPIDPDGVTALMFSHLSPKRGTAEIGRFGLGFKSVLGVTDAPEFFSRSGSFRFDRAKAANLIQPTAPDAGRYPVLRLPEAIDPWPETATDPVLRSLMGWAVNIVRLPLKQGAYEALSRQIGEFPSEFLLFVGHVSELVLRTAEQEAPRTISLRGEDGHFILGDGGNETRWVLVSSEHELSTDARSDSRSLDNATVVQVSWAAPIDRLNEPGHFWAFFPTMTTSLLAGILNAPWKTNEDRQNLLPGVYNDELIDFAAAMVARALPRLSSPEDPARHLDALPRRAAAGDSEHSARLRNQLHSHLRDREIVPDQAGELRKLLAIRYPPREITEAGQAASVSLGRWAAYDRRPAGWLHHSALTRNRLAALERLSPIMYPLPRATVAEWLEALVEGANTEREALEASMAAIQTAALLQEALEAYEDLGEIVFTADGSWVAPDPDSVFLGGGHTFDQRVLVHPQLEADAETLGALEALGVCPASPETAFREFVSQLFATPIRLTDSDDWGRFWELARGLEDSDAAAIIQSHARWRSSLLVHTVSGLRRSLFNALLPGPIVPLDGSRDGDVAIDTRFHEPDLPLLDRLGAVDVPHASYELSPVRSERFTQDCRDLFTQRDLPRSPQRQMLNFRPPATTAGPLDVLGLLSDEAKALYTLHLLNLRATYELWTMRHDTQDIYPPMSFDSPAVEALRRYGRIETGHGIHQLSDGLGDEPKDPSVLRVLLTHPQADLIRRVFDLAEIDAPVDPVGEDAPIPLVDMWPGLEPSLSMKQRALELIRCDGFRSPDGRETPDCILSDRYAYVLRKGDEEQELRSVLQGLGLRLTDEQVSRVLLRLTHEDVQRAREAVRGCSTDEERLLAAVGEAELRRGLPRGLLAILEGAHEPLSGAQIAQAAISTFHIGALREYRHALAHLDPPRQWAGRPRAVEFVRSLGFDEEWAGDPNPRREPYVEVDGPYTLPGLHDYQRRVVGKVRGLIRSDGTLGERRGMISMPTGSGKTRVAVQAIVEAMREDGFRGGILWVADRDELCEQAVEAWRQVWASEGPQAQRLRISRMWAGQPQPLPTSEMHVIVATIQTLSAKVLNQPGSYEFLADFNLLVFDEAHRSVAPTFTSVMEELGLTRWRRAHEPLLIGLTATPYRGHDERETARLVNRYGSNRLDKGAFTSDDPQTVIRELQSMRVLAQADHATIEGGQFSLSDDELLQSQQVPWLPRGVEDRIADDPGRTRRIIRAYVERIDPDWPTLVFATSVEHSQTVAALLTQEGIKARAVSASTETSIRRRVVEEFRAGEIKALVNYGIFREGFDAPKTRAIVVARPVYSPNLYFQMIGRGLRGVKNGGNDQCLILNVRDNIENFERKLAFSDLDWLWA